MTLHTCALIKRHHKFRIIKPLNLLNFASEFKFEINFIVLSHGWDKAACKQKRQLLVETTSKIIREQLTPPPISTPLNNVRIVSPKASKV